MLALILILATSLASFVPDPNSLTITLKALCPGVAFVIEGTEVRASQQTVEHMRAAGAQEKDPYCTFYCILENKGDEPLLVDAVGLCSSLSGCLSLEEEGGKKWKIDQVAKPIYDGNVYKYPVAPHSRSEIVLTLTRLRLVSDGAGVPAPADRPKTPRYQFIEGARLDARPLTKNGLGVNQGHALSAKGVLDLSATGP